MVIRLTRLSHARHWLQVCFDFSLVYRAVSVSSDWFRDFASRDFSRVYHRLQVHFPLLIG